MTEFESLDTSGLTPKQQEALTLLVTGHSPLQTAEKCQISVDTIYSWRSQHPVFGDLEKRIIRSRLHEAVRQVQGMVPTVLTTLLTVITNEQASNRDRIAASKLLLDLAGVDGRAVAGEPDLPSDMSVLFRHTAEEIAGLVRSVAGAG